MPRPRHRTTPVRGVAALALLALASACAAAFEKLPEAARDDARRAQVAFDFDKDSCYPSPAVSTDGRVNGGLEPTGPITGGCRDPKQLENSNTYHRRAAVTKGKVEYAVHMYALYFMKDQWAPATPTELPGSHRHDWEYALVWTRDGRVTHASTSAHGKVTTKPRAELHFDPDRPDTVKVVYHKDDARTHAFRFAKAGEAAENHAERWVTPTLVDWHVMKGAGASNEALRKTFNAHDFGGANCSFNDENFPAAIAREPPAGDGYPTADEWRQAAADGK